MTTRQEKHLQNIKQSFAADVDAKYRKGAKEHGNDLMDSTPLALLNMAIEEAVDQYTYLVSLREKLLAEVNA